MYLSNFLRAPGATTARLTILLATLLSCAASASEAGGAAELLIEDANGQRQQALLLDTAYSGRVDGLVASLTLRQRFRNQTDEWVNGEYLVPLPDRAAVDSLTLETAGKRIRGVVKEKRQAKREFEAAKAAGKKAGLVEQRRPNLFSMQLANIPPNGEVLAEITWVETIAFKGGRFSLTLPTTLTPRFIPGQPLSIPGEVTEFSEAATVRVRQGSGWALNTDQVPDASLITPPQIKLADAGTSNRFTTELTIAPGIEVTGISSVTHSLAVADQGASGATWKVELAAGSEPMDRDLVLEWRPAAASLPQAAVFTQSFTPDSAEAGGGENYESAQHTLLMVMPPVQNIVQTLPRELIFIIDSSGSMAGVSMPQAQQGLKTALGYLTANDRFNVIDFDSSAQALFPQPQAVTPENLRRATDFVDGLDADGGTNMEAALELAFSQQAEEGYLRQIVFITDGSVGNEAALFNLIHRRLGEARLFTMGIGAAPNSHFMRGAARYGRGSYHFISDLNQAATRMAELFARINRPVMRDITVTWPDGSEVDTVPERAPDLYLGEPLMLVSRSAKPLSQVVVAGSLAGQPWQRTVNLATAGSADNLDKVWARGKVEQLESQQIMAGEPMENVRDEIVKIGVDHQLATRFTSFVAIEEEVSRPEGESSLERTVPNLLPKGSKMQVPLPNTATAATLLSVLGGLLLSLAGLLKLWAGRGRIAGVARC